MGRRHLRHHGPAPLPGHLLLSETDVLRVAFLLSVRVSCPPDTAQRQLKGSEWGDLPDQTSLWPGL